MFTGIGMECARIQRGQALHSSEFMYVIADLIVLFTAIGLTYLGAHLWTRLQPLVADWRVLIRHGQAAACEAIEAITDPHPGSGAAAGQATDRAVCGHGAFEVCFEINGMEIDPGKLTHIVSKSLLRTIHHSVRKRASSVRCPDHGSAGRVVVTGSSLSDLSWHARGCCPALQAALSKKLRNGA